MILNNEFTVAADIGTVWRQLLDMEGVASCLPGASVTATDEENTYQGTMRLKIGPMKVEYRGRATLEQIDEQRHTAVIALSAREAKGQGTAVATIRNQLEQIEGATRVRAQTELNITGPQAQFGHGVIEDVGGRVMAEFSRRLEERIAGSERDATGGAGAATGGSDGTTESADATEQPVPERSPTRAADTNDDVLDLGMYVPPRVVKRTVGVLAALMVAVLLLRYRRR
jgi:carbon monoxide dehydrogenase subunit G